MSDEVEVYDPHNMIRETSMMVGDLERSLKQDLRLPQMEFDRIVISGMGGSAIGGSVRGFMACGVSGFICRAFPSWAV